VKLLAIALLLALPCCADEILMKDGRKIPFGTIVDRGQDYEVTADGKKTVVRKSEIDRISIDPSETVLLTGATFTKIQGKTRIVNCLAAIDPKRLYGNAGIEAKLQGTTLMLDLKSDNPTRLEVPVKLGDEYDFVAVVERKDGVGDFYIGLVGDGRPFLVRFDSDSGIHTGIHGAKIVDTGKQILPKDKPTTIECFVRRESVIIKIDGKELVNWRADWSQVQIPESHSLPDGKNPPLIGSQKIPGTFPNLWKVHKLSVTIKAD